MTRKQLTESLGHEFIVSDLSDGSPLQTLKIINRMLALVAPGYSIMFNDMAERGHNYFAITLMKVKK